MAAARLQQGSKRLAWALLALVGYILSPLSWWNDVFVNVPIALTTAWLLNTLLGVNKAVGFYIGYMASNILGLYLLALGVSGAAAKRIDRQTLAKIMVMGAIYTLAAMLVLGRLGLL
ncbi:MAG TPA: hypothetical protein EYH50_01875 [Pyrodictium delaneyi]|uniref:Uncharacterized protein n=1 Tax=Pyrodictium delaneyi TaxID=1273541 RepID=A0A832ZSU4_9CREN|nr:hypothetical protein [Pyrodictium delaneyi]